MNEEMTEPQANGWYIDEEDGEAWLKTDEGYRLLDGYSSGGGFEETNFRTWDEVKIYGPLHPATQEELDQEIQTSALFKAWREQQEGRQS